MYLYHVEIVTTEEKNLVAAVIAETEEAAFHTAHALTKRQFHPTPTIKTSTLLEKKYIEKGKGFVFAIS
ncbi:DUF3906 family protein [Brevibacillus halotolerans]|uniref:DUF3906 family protein n=1 Tax=Brevibacillus halotolerans TaxID=1507437 RepID=UPI0015EEFF69|nr:DUF3906 family protein [Brevibacillus halotolerans]MBA4531364.1 DUF3906 family protein [Brevibacillus halotolerans]